MDEYDLEQLEQLWKEMEQYWETFPWEELEQKWSFFRNELNDESHQCP